jgi:zinc transport system substrate-binding protein
MYVEAINVARDIPGVTVLNMTKAQTGCLHDYQLTPEDLKTLESADVFIINGAGMEAFMTDIISQQAGLDIISASEGIPLIKDAAGNDNPHVWVSVTNAMTQVNTLAAQMADLDPTYASDYAANAAAYNQKLEALKVKMHAALDDIKNRDIITFHEAFPYFAQEFGFRIVAVIEREPGTSPSPKELESTIAIVAQSGVKALFVEPQYPAKAAEAIALETGARLYDLDPAVTGIASPEGYDDYIWIMEQNLAVLEEALK